MPLEITTILGPYFSSCRYTRGTALWREGDMKGMLVSLVSGRVKISRHATDGKSVTLYIMKPGNVFGFLPLIDGGPYPVDAEALEEVHAFVITHDRLMEVLDQDPRIAFPLLRYLSEHLRSAFNLILRISSRDALSRVASALHGLLEETNGSDIRLPVSAKEYASLLGLTPESFSRKITELVEMGVLKRTGINRFLVIDADRLQGVSIPDIFL